MLNRNDNRFGTVEAVKKIGISAERLRYWEQRGIVNPKYVQCATRRFRRYSQKDIQGAIFVKMLVDREGYALEGAIRKLKRKGANLSQLRYPK
jgi:DNA-binding transcriptional MerR regulator